MVVVPLVFEDVGLLSEEGVVAFVVVFGLLSPSSGMNFASYEAERCFALSSSFVVVFESLG